jgi:hypothetical protein
MGLLVWQLFWSLKDVPENGIPAEKKELSELLKPNFYRKTHLLYAATTVQIESKRYNLVWAI